MSDTVPPDAATRAARQRVAAKVRALRATRFPTRTSFAVKAGMHVNQAEALEHDAGSHDYGLKTLARIARALNVSTSVLVDAYLDAAPSPESVPPHRLRRDAGGAAAFGNELRRQRQRAGLTLPQLEQVAGVHHNYAGMLERGEIASPGLQIVVRLAIGIGADPEEQRAVAVRLVRVFAAELPAPSRPPRRRAG